MEADGRWLAGLQDPWTSVLSNQPTQRLDPIRGGRVESELEPSTADVRVDHVLCRHCAFIRTTRLLTLTDTELAPSLGIYYIRPPLVMDKFIPVNSRVIMCPPKISLLLAIERTPTVIIKPSLILVMHTEHLNRNKTFN